MKTDLKLLELAANWCCEKGRALGVRVCPECDETSRAYSAAMAPECAKHCQQAVDYGVWPEASCKPSCVYLNRPAADQPADRSPAKEIGSQP